MQVKMRALTVLKQRVSLGFLALAGLMLAPTPFTPSLLTPTADANPRRGQISDETISFAVTFDTNEYARQTFLQFMKTSVKPAMDVIATDGYKVASGDDVRRAYELSDVKVKRKVDRDFGGLETVVEIADALAGETVTAETLPQRIRSVNRSVDAYKLANFLGLASGGGVALRFAPGNYALNVHYDVTEQKSGRSYGVGPGRLANDASDKDYLDDLEAYTRANTDDLGDFYTVLMAALMDTDTSGYHTIEKEGQAVLSDFLAVYTAEQARNLMDGRITSHWDAALLEVTLLAAFHAGQEKVELIYLNPITKRVTFTDETLRQTPCAEPDRSGEAHLRDYWQFSRRIEDPSNCRRSGINITRKEFRALGQRITAYLQENHPELVASTVAATDPQSNATSSKLNLFQMLSDRLIDANAPAKYSQSSISRAQKAWRQVIETINAEAPEISAAIRAERSLQ